MFSFSHKRVRTLLLAVAQCAGLGLWANSALAEGDDSYVDVMRGKYLATLADCAACHTVPGGKPFAGGLRINTPFGTIVSANITPDPLTGMGTWSLDDFQRMMSTGISKNGEHLYAAMPYNAYTKMTAKDNAAIYVYLQTLEPVNNLIETNQLKFPFNFRFEVGMWNMLNLKVGEYKPDPNKSDEWNRGAYIVQGPGHCGSCHTPKDLIGGDKTDALLQGFAAEGMLAPNITADGHKGIGKWAVEDITAYLKTGANRFDVASGGMGDEVEHSSSHWTDADLKSVAVYLKDFNPNNAAPPAPIPADDKAMKIGKAIYEDRCSGCHMPNGEGIATLFPRIAQAPLINNDDASSLIKVILAGSEGVATDAHPTAPKMPSFAWNFDNDQVAAVVTYIRNSWGNAAPRVSATDVNYIRTGENPNWIWQNVQALAFIAMAIGALVALLLLGWIMKCYCSRKTCSK